MGNVEISTDSLFKEYECSTGKMLLKAIRVNSQKQVEEAIEFARKQLINPSLKKSHDEDYQFMTQKILQYLTRKYDVGDGFLSWKTPVEYAMSTGANHTLDYLKDTIIKLGRTDNAKRINAEKSPSISAAVGTIDGDRVALAKSRLHTLRHGGAPGAGAENN